MKKKISLLGLILILVFSFSGCGKSDDTVEYDQEQLEQYADFIVQNFSMMGEADFQNFSDMSDLELEMTLLQAGVPVTGENFLTMMGAWDAGEQECGEFVGLKDGYTMETTNEGALLTVEGDFAERDGALEFAFDKKGNIESLTIGAHYSTAEILKKAGLNTILGMGTVFVVLIFISFIISLFKFIPALEQKFKKSAKTEIVNEKPTAALKTEMPEVSEDVTEDTELAAVIAAAIAASEGTSADGFIVRSMKRRKSNKWN